MRPPQIGFPALLQSFFQQRLVTQRGAHGQTPARVGPDGFQTATPRAMRSGTHAHKKDTPLPVLRAVALSGLTLRE